MIVDSDCPIQLEKRIRDIDNALTKINSEMRHAHTKGTKFDLNERRAALVNSKNDLCYRLRTVKADIKMNSQDDQGSRTDGLRDAIKSLAEGHRQTNDLLRKIWADVDRIRRQLEFKPRSP